MKSLKYIIALGTLVSASSCGESFFDLQPNYEVTVERIYKTADDFNIAVMGCYAKLQTQNSYYLECCEFRSDNLYLKAPTSGTQDRYDIDQFKDVATNSILEDCWANFDNGVYRCNMVLDRIDNADFDQALKNQYKGEAMFIRAYTYFNMYRAWGGVPTTRRVVSVEEALAIGRSTDDEMFALIAGDLEQIISENLLPDSYKGTDIGRITSGAAKALLAKVYLTFGKAQQAANILAGMIGSYSLLPSIQSVFDVDNKMNAEIIWAIRYNKSVVGEGHGAWYSITNLTDSNNQTDILTNLYDDNDARKQMIEYVQVPGVKVCLLRKLYDTPDPTNNTYGNDMIVLRYADVLLMYAEALNEVGYNGNSNWPALEALNAVHTRAGLAPINIGDVPITAFQINCGADAGNCVILHLGDSNFMPAQYQVTEAVNVCIPRYAPNELTENNVIGAVFNPDYVLMSHILELSHTDPENSRWTLNQGLERTSKINCKNSYMPFWGEKLTWKNNQLK